MDYFEINYYFISEWRNTLSEAAKRGFELRLGCFVFDPKSKTYDYELTKKLEGLEKWFYSQTPEDEKEYDTFTSSHDEARLEFTLSHPIVSLRAYLMTIKSDSHAGGFSEEEN